MTRSLYLVTNGRAEHADSATQDDGVESVLVLAYNEADAIAHADAYDRGEIEAGNEVVDGETVGCLCARPPLAVQAVAKATTLAALMSALQATAALPDEDQAEIDWTDLPTFGGAEPDDTDGVWSWDAESLLVGTCAADLKIEPRDESGE